MELNAERAAEERRGLIRWLRPGFQNPGGAGTVQGEEEFLFNDNHAGKREGIHDRSRDGIQRST